MNMKTMIFAGVFLLNVGIAAAQKVDSKEVPQNVKSTLVKLFPKVNASDVKWKLDKGNYKAEFNSSKEYDVFIDKSGKWVATEIEIKHSELPKEVKQSLASGEYKDWKVTEIEQVENTEYKVLYELNVVKDGEPEYEITYDPAGKLISKEKE